jgi:hypothetical protein
MFIKKEKTEPLAKWSLMMWRVKRKGIPLDNNIHRGARAFLSHPSPCELSNGLNNSVVAASPSAMVVACRPPLRARLAARGASLVQDIPAGKMMCHTYPSPAEEGKPLPPWLFGNSGICMPPGICMPRLIKLIQNYFSRKKQEVDWSVSAWALVFTYNFQTMNSWSYNVEGR